MSKNTPGTDPKAAVVTNVPVDGMTCRACEVRIGRTMSKLPGVISAVASTRKGQVVITSREALDLEAATERIEALGYTVGRGSRAWISRDAVIWTDIVRAVALVAIFVAVWIGFDLGRFSNQLSQAATGGNLIFVVLLGVAASLSTCMALVGGIVIGLSARFAQKHPDATRAQRLRPQAMFNLGRIIGFSALGALLGAIGSVFSFNGIVLGGLLVVVAVVMGTLGLKLTGVSPRLASSAFTLPSSWTRWLPERNGEYRDLNAALLGAASFFLPCGFTQAVQVYAVSLGDPAQAALVMGLFALGTTPGLMGVGALSALARGDHAKRVFSYIGVAVVAFAVLNLAGGLNVLSVALPASTSSTSADRRTSNVHDEDGLQVVRTVVDGGYDPANATVYAGEPVRWQLDAASNFDCATSIDASQLGIEGYVSVTGKGFSVMFTAPKQPGVYRYTCSMGMYDGSFTVIQRPA